MNDILLAFVTGLTTGGLSCLAVQGRRLLAGSIAHEVEQNGVATPGRAVRPCNPQHTQARKRSEKAAAGAAWLVPAPLKRPQLSPLRRPSTPQHARHEADPALPFGQSRGVHRAWVSCLACSVRSSISRLTMRVDSRSGSGCSWWEPRSGCSGCTPIFRYFALEPPRRQPIHPAQVEG